MNNSNNITHFLNKLFNEWIEKKIIFLVLRNYSDLPEFIENDVDILVSPKQLKKAEGILYNSINDTNWVLINKSKFSCLAYYFYNTQTLEVIHIDLMPGNRWHSFSFINDQMMLNTRKSFKSFFIGSSEYEAVVNLMTRLLYTGYIKNDYKKNILTQVLDNEHSLTNILNASLGERLSREIINNIKDEDWSYIENKIFIIRIHILIKNLKKPILLIRNLLSDLVRLLNRYFNNPGISVVMIGPDGCGKTTTANLLKHNLFKVFNLPHSIHYHWKPIPKKNKENRISDNPHAVLPRSKFMSFLYFVYHHMTFIFGWVFYVQPSLFKNGLVIIDRYYYDFFVDSKRYRMNLSDMILKIGFVFIKKPDLVFYLDANPKILQKRKQEVSFSETVRQRDDYLKLISHIPNGIIIDASQGINEVVKDMQLEIFNFMNQRCKKRNIL